MYSISLALMLVAVGYFALYRVQATKPLLLLLGVASASGLLLHSAQARQFQWTVERFHGNSHFGQLQVLDRRDGLGRFYLNDNLIQNTYDTERKQSESAFTYLLSGLARAYTTNINDVLCIGLGVGIVPMDFARRGARVDVVEINPAVMAVGQRFFDLQPEKLHITIDDARHFLNRCRSKYDAVILDAFLGDSSPSHLLTREAFASIRRVLRPGGTLSINSFGNLEAGQNFFTASLNKTLKSVFRGVRMHDSGTGGIFFAATDRPEPDFVHPPDFSGIHARALEDTQKAFVTLVDTPPEDGRVLTDDYNPVEYYDAHNRELIRRHLAMAAKER
jgi:spermidine synthase